MKRMLFVVFVVLISAAIVPLVGQLSIAVQPATGFATTIPGCPTATSGFILCTVVPASGQPFLALSVAGYNAGAPFSLASSGGVTSFNGRTGAVTLTKADITGTGIAATSSTTATTTASTTTTLQ